MLALWDVALTRRQCRAGVSTRVMYVATVESAQVEHLVQQLDRSAVLA
jgi:hypothetical protein